VPIATSPRCSRALNAPPRSSSRPAAERIEYDERTEIVRFIRRANWKRLENEQPRDEVVGQLITYNAQSASYSVDGAPAGAGDGRVRLILAPRDSGTAPARPPAALRPAPQIEGKK